MIGESSLREHTYGLGHNQPNINEVGKEEYDVEWVTPCLSKRKFEIRIIEDFKTIRNIILRFVPSHCQLVQKETSDELRQSILDRFQP